MRSDSMFVEAAKEDVPEIIALRHQIWGTTYRGIYPDICSKKTIKISAI